MTVDTIISGGLVVLPGTEGDKVDILIKNGKIVGLVESSFGIEAKERVDAKGHVILPGGIDPHVHMGLYLSPESDWKTETEAAAAGGVTTLVDYLFDKDPYNISIPREIERAQKYSVVDFTFSPGIFMEEHFQEMESCMSEYGITSFKYTGHWKGYEKVKLGTETVLDDGFLYRILDKAGKYPGLQICVHSQNVEITYPPFAKSDYSHHLVQKNKHLDGLALWEAINPDFAETEYVQKALYIAEQTGAHVYIVHISAGSTVQYLRNKDLKGMNVIGETCTSYLGLTTDAPSGLLAKVNPPVRKETDQNLIWEGIRDGIIKTIGTDTVPCTREVKFQNGNGTLESKLGFCADNTFLPVIATHGWAKRGIPLSRIAEVFSTNAAKTFHMYPQKGAIAVGSDADLVIADFTTEKEVKASDLPSIADYNIFEGQKLVGWPVQTIIRGKTIWKDGKITMSSGYGRFIKRDGHSLLEGK